MPCPVIKGTVFSLSFGATLDGAYTTEIIEVLDDRHKYINNTRFFGFCPHFGD
jgi:hypothetical protein